MEQDTLQPPPLGVPPCLAARHPDPLILSFARQLCAVCTTPLSVTRSISIISSTVSVPQGLCLIALIFLNGPNMREQ